MKLTTTKPENMVMDATQRDQNITSLVTEIEAWFKDQLKGENEYVFKWSNTYSDEVLEIVKNQYQQSGWGCVIVLKDMKKIVFKRRDW
jgi:hypothetical protein